MWSIATEWKSLITNVDWKIVIDCLKSLLFHSATYKWSRDVLYHSLVFTSSCGWIEEQILETIIKIRRGIKRPDTESISSINNGCCYKYYHGRYQRKRYVLMLLIKTTRKPRKNANKKINIINGKHPVS